MGLTNKELQIVNKLLAGDAGKHLKTLASNPDLLDVLHALKDTTVALQTYAKINYGTHLNREHLISYLANRYSSKIKKGINDTLLNTPKVFEHINSIFLNNYLNIINPRLSLLGIKHLSPDTNTLFTGVRSLSDEERKLHTQIKAARFAQNYGMSPSNLQGISSALASSFAPSDQADAVAASFASLIGAKVYTPEQLATIKVATDV